MLKSKHVSWILLLASAGALVACGTGEYNLEATRKGQNTNSVNTADGSDDTSTSVIQGSWTTGDEAFPFGTTQCIRRMITIKGTALTQAIAFYKTTDCSEPNPNLDMCDGTIVSYDPATKNFGVSDPSGKCNSNLTVLDSGEIEFARVPFHKN